VSGAYFEHPHKLYLADTDATGIAYYARHLEWMEAARVEMIAQVYKPLARLIAEDGVSFVPIRVDIRYKTPAAFGDVVKVRVGLQALERLKMVLGYRLVKEADGREAVVAEAEITLVCVDVTKGSRPARIPETLKNALAACQANAQA
jgi:acyl-CoA thioester hydrolase